MEKSDIKKIKKISTHEVRILVDNYYRTQKERIRLDSQIRAIKQGYDDGDQGLIVGLQYQSDQAKLSEAFNNKLLKIWASNNEIAKVCMEPHGIGHVLAAGLTSSVNWSISSRFDGVSLRTACQIR